MARKSKSVAKHQISEIASSLKAKAAIPITVSLEDTILALAAPIQSMLDAGYSYADVAEVFKSHGVAIAASSIKSYHRHQIQSSGQDPNARHSSAGEISSSPDRDRRSDVEQISSSSSDDNGSHNAQSERSGDDLPPAVPKPNSQASKNLSARSTQTKSQFNLTDRQNL